MSNEFVDSIVNDVVGGGGTNQPTIWQGLTVAQLVDAYQAGRISSSDLRGELAARKSADGVRIYSDSAIDELITSARVQSAGSSVNPAVASPGDFMNGAVESRAPTAGGRGATGGAANAMPGTYSDATEAWRPLVAQYFKPEDVDKALYVIEHESGGDPNAAGDGGASIGLFQMNTAGGLGQGIDPSVLRNGEQNIKLAAQAVYGGSGWSPWGEGSLYNGKPFGALGNAPYPGGASSSAPASRLAAATPSGTTSGGMPRGFDEALNNFKLWQQPRADQLSFRAATGTPGDFPGIRVSLADLGQTFRNEGLNADILNGVGSLRGGMDIPSSSYFSDLGLVPFADGGSVGPAGRTYDQATGQDYLSEAERAWYLRELINRGGNPSAEARQWLAQYEARAPQQGAPGTAPAVANMAEVRPLTAQEQARINQQNLVTASQTAQGKPPQAASSVANPASASSWSYNGPSVDTSLRDSISAFNDWQRPRFEQLQFNARTGLPSDFPGIRVSLADLAQNYRTQGLDARQQLNGLGQFAGGQSLPASDYFRNLGFASGGDVEVFGSSNSMASNNAWQPRGRSPQSVETNRPSALDGLYKQAVTRYVGPNETDVGILGKSAAFGGFQNLSNILRNLNTIGRNFQGQDLSAGYRIPGFNPLQSELYQRLFRSAVPTNVQYADGGTAGMGGPGMVGMNPDGTPHLTLDGPATLVDDTTGAPLAKAGEVGMQEQVRPTPGGGLDFQPTSQPQSGMMSAVGPETQRAVISAITQLLSGRNSRQRRGRYQPAPVGSTPPPSARLSKMLGAA